MLLQLAMGCNFSDLTEFAPSCFSVQHLSPVAESYLQGRAEGSAGSLCGSSNSLSLCWVPCISLPQVSEPL